MKRRKVNALKREIENAMIDTIESNYCWECPVCTGGMWNHTFGYCWKAANTIINAKAIKGARLRYLVRVIPQPWLFQEKPKFNGKRKYLLERNESEQITIIRCN